MKLTEKVLNYLKSSVIWARDVHGASGSRIQLAIYEKTKGRILVLHCNEGSENGGVSSIPLGVGEAESLIAYLKQALNELKPSPNSVSSAT